MLILDKYIDIPWYPLHKINILNNSILSLNKYRSTDSRILHISIWKRGHLSCCICYKWTTNVYWLHQIVARIKYWYWAPDWMVVCHNDGNPKNNHPDNLRYWTRSDNTMDSIKHWTHPKNYKKVNQYSIEWEFIKEWESIKLAVESLWLYNSWISQCIRWIIKTSGWYRWSYTNITQ